MFASAIKRSKCVQFWNTTQKRRAAHEEERERGQTDARHRVVTEGERPFATVGDRHRPCSDRRCAPQEHSHSLRNVVYRAPQGHR